MEKINLENKILEALKKEDLKPISKWKFVFHEYFLYFLIFISLLALTISFGAIFFILDNLDFASSRMISGNIFVFLWRFLPVFWIILSFVGLYFVRIFWDRTKSGYKWKGENIVALSLILGFIFGLTLHLYMDAGRSFDEGAERFVPMHRSFDGREKDLWLRRDEGRVVGKVLQVYSDKALLEERTGEQEFIYFKELVVPGKNMVATDSIIKVVGYKNGESFVACFVFPGRPQTFVKKFFGKNPNKEVMENSFETMSEECKRVLPGFGVGKEEVVGESAR